MQSTSINAPAWLMARPIAHRGLHDRAAGIPENTIAAAEAAIAGGYAIECDVQPSAEGEAMVFHDVGLGRLTRASEKIASRTVSELAALTVAGTSERIPTLSDFLARVGGRTPLVIEIKSTYSDDLTLTRRVAEIIAGYEGPIALKSFDPRIVQALITLAPLRPRGIIAQGEQEDGAYARLQPSERHALANLLHLHHSRPDFVSWPVAGLPAAQPYLCRLLGGMPAMTWTVRTDVQRKLAAEHADQIVFEGFRP